MTAQFNLVDEPWIPCIRLDGHRTMCGIKETLETAHRVREIFDDSPLVTIALHRLLLAILHRLFGPADAAAWASIWQQGQGTFDSQAISTYLPDPVRHSRFDLFDGPRPFYQARAVPAFTIDPHTKKRKSYAVSAAKLATYLAAGHNETLFDHTDDDSFPGFRPDEAARFLVAAQSFSPSGTITDECKAGKRSATASPLFRGAVALVSGANLFQTLMLNLHQYSAEDEEPFPFDPEADAPAWEQDQEPLLSERPPRGYLDVLTWQSRRILLLPENDGMVIRRIVMMDGYRFPKDLISRDRETMLAFVANPTARGKASPWNQVSFREERSLWRDSLSLFQSVSHRRARPKTLAWLAELCEEGTLPRRAAFQLDLLGLAPDPVRAAKVNLWRHERLPLPLAYLDDPELVACLEHALTVAEAGADVLRQSCWFFARLAVVRDEDKPLNKQKKNEISQLADSLAGERRYWPRLELPFLHLLEDLPGNVDERPDAISTHRDQRLAEWTDTVRRTARKSFQETVSGFDRTARFLKAAVRAEGGFMRELDRRLPKEEDKNEPIKSA